VNERIRTLDGLRGIAILLVLAGHSLANFQPLSAAWRHWGLVFANPGAGVRIFFVLSGYLITLLLIVEKRQTGTISLYRFYQRRLFRILPAFYFYLTVLVLLSLRFPVGVNTDTFLAAATFTWNYQGLWAVPPPEGYWNLGHLWTLSLEQQFYLLWPASLLLLGVYRARWATFALIAWCPLARISTYFIFPEQRGFIGMMFHTAVDSLMFGCAAAILAQSNEVMHWFRSRSTALAAMSAAWLMIISPPMGEWLRGFPVAFGYTLDAAASSCLVLWLHHSPTTWVHHILGRGLLPLLGAISYSLYLWQQLFLSPVGLLGSGYLLAPLGASIAAAGFSYYCVEKPILGLQPRRARLMPS
jgi:peptidoglycan/LPS O-acetylase OafA/YrhL